MPNKSRIYLDYAATTPLDPAVLKIMNEAGERYYANPSSLHYPGQESKVAIEQARHCRIDPGESPGNCFYRQRNRKQ